MKFTETSINDVYRIEIEKKGDIRGYFARNYCEKEFLTQGIPMKIVQANTGYSKHKYTIRGLHYQEEPHSEAKLVRCLKGKVFDVVVDARPQSSTYKKWVGIELSEDNRQMVYVPPGCAHGYQTLIEDTELFYMVSAFYAPNYERGIRWDDPEFNIEWINKKNITISNKDQNWPDFRNV